MPPEGAAAALPAADPALLRAASTPRAREEWRNRVHAEYRSAAVTAQVLQWSIRFGLPRAVQDTAHRIVRDELDHAALSHRCWVALGGDGEPLELEESELAAPDDPAGPLASLLETILYSFCFGETLAVPLFSEMRRQARLPAARAALDRILRDEAVHRAFAWDALAALVALDPPGVQAWVGGRLPQVTARFRSAYGEVPDGTPLSPAEEAAGLLAPARYRAIFAETLEGEIRPRLARLGLPTGA